MHYHAEIIMPPTDDVEAAIEKILAPFSENAEDDVRNHPFWDWYQIGGRYSGSKLEATVSQEQKDAFMAALKERKVTVSDLQCGKQELSPASQIPMVDALWREMCPGAGDVCPIFQHSGREMNGDVCKVSEIPEGLTAYTVIIAGPSYGDGKFDGPAEAKYLAHKSIWNGVTHQDTEFKGNVAEALAGHAKRAENYRDDYRQIMTVQPDWLCVTVDYHS